MSVRIVTGMFAGRKLDVPDNSVTRPTMDKTREAVFNILRHRHPELDGAVVLDVFAGSGAYGFESISNGASEVTFFENDRIAQRVLSANIQKLGVDCILKIIAGDVLSVSENCGKIATHAFFDPPYGKGLLSSALKSLGDKRWIDENTICIIEREKGKETADILPERFKSVVERTYGRSCIVLGNIGKV